MTEWLLYGSGLNVYRETSVTRGAVAVAHRHSECSCLRPGVQRGHAVQTISRCSWGVAEAPVAGRFRGAAGDDSIKGAGENG